VHRDFKPENVLIGADGRPRVTDFGLARSAAQAAQAAVEGTPAYMAPEQFQGEADARSDQFAFCVALYAALFGAHPFAGGKGPAPPPAGSGVPASARRALMRGLSPRPEERWPTMDELLAALARAAAGPRTLAVAAAAAVIALAAVGAWATVGRHAPTSGFVDRCGNGRVDPGEECDPRAGDGSGCNATCVRCGPAGAAFTWAANGHCYVRSDEPATFDVAESSCAAGGGHLVSYTGQTEVAAVTGGILRGSTGPSWVGMRAPAPGEALLWRWREPFVTGMMPSLPPPTYASGTCFAQQGARLPWVAVPCTQALPFVCEVPGWVVHAKTGHAYRELFGAHTWYEARDRCARMGAHLATVGDPDEHGFLASHLYGQYWIGASRSSNREPFRWVTGEPFGYQEFVPGDPDVPVPPACLIMGEDRTWRDRPCAGEDRFPYACEMD
jgi:hypothetical protein